MCDDCFHCRDKPKNEIWIVMEYCGAGSVSDLMQICDITLSEDEISVVCKCVRGCLFSFVCCPTRYPSLTDTGCYFLFRFLFSFVDSPSAHFEIPTSSWFGKQDFNVLSIGG